ncbi:transposase [Plakobranchus ocellatus]|uniref:Transposase n=1 Tax=Plakobranchus ocellatus TaxID=259542 RepID=A0AAV3ZWN9_9GAST|nr:transposase [Plakobranchus ocellatus]
MNVYEIVHDKLGYHKVSARWIPNHRARNKLLEHLITGDESRLHPSTSETKRDSMTWKYLSSPVTKKFKIQQSATKVMATVSWDSRGIIL